LVMMPGSPADCRSLPGNSVRPADDENVYGHVDLDTRRVALDRLDDERQPDRRAAEWMNDLRAAS
jgi:hypothetical protein